MIEIKETLVVSLAADERRRAHIQKHLTEFGLGKFSIIDATPADSDAVRDTYMSGKVANFPICFRCNRSIEPGFFIDLMPRFIRKKYKCKCENNIIIPQQVANWLSFIEVWKYCAQFPDDYFMICEDDVAFHHNARQILDRFTQDFSPTRQNVLIRMCSSGERPFQNLPETYELSDRPVMSNAAHILNGHMAALLLQQFKRIETTSDVWVHEVIAAREDVQAVTIEPLLATDLSFNKDFAQFASRIHPKGINAEDADKLRTHVRRVENRREYEKLFQKWTQRPS